MATVSTAAAPLLAGASSAAAATAPDTILNINGRDHQLAFDVRTSLLDLLREHLGLTGTKKVCDHGQCGACTVLLDGRRELYARRGRPRPQCHDIEGLATNGELHPMQLAFIDHDAFQCGYCMTAEPGA